MSENNEELIVQEDIGLATRDRTVRHIGKSLKQSLKRKYGIKGNEVADNLLRIAGMHPDFFDALNMDSRIVEERLNDASIDSNSNKSEKTISGIEQETSAPKNKAVGHDYLYREIKYLYGHDEAQRLTGEMYDYSLGISDSTKLRLPYSYYAHTPVIVRINGEVSVVSLKKLFDMFKHHSEIVCNADVINCSNIKNKICFDSIYSISGKTKLKQYKEKNSKINNAPCVMVSIEVWDASNGWVNVSRIVRHKNDCGYTIYQTKDGDFAFVTDNHPIYMEDGSEKNAGELVIGDKIMKEDNLPDVKENFIVGEDLAYFTGFLVGDGNIDNGDIDYSKKYGKFKTGIVFERGGKTISVYQKDINNSHIKKVIDRVFNGVNYWSYNEKSDRQIGFSSRDYRLLSSMEFGFDGKENSFTKHLPENIMSWDTASKIAFICGLIDSDGTVFESGRVDIRMMSYASIVAVYDVLRTIPGVVGLRKRICGDNIDNIIFGVQFRVVGNNDFKRLSEKMKDVNIESYNESHDTVVRGLEINKIIRFDSHDISDTRFLKNELDYVYDITTDTGRFYANGMVQHNCFAIDASRLITEGRPFGQLPSLPVQNLRGYISCLTETIHQMSCHLAGAIAVGSFFLDVANVCMYKHKYTMKHLKRRKIRKEIQNSFQHFVHSVNMLSRNSVESPFTNVSICDKTKLKNMVKEMEFMFNVDNLPTGFIKKMFMRHNKEYFYNYLVDYIYELQNIYLDFFDKGAPSLNGAPYRFPVTTLCLSKHKNKDGEWEITEEKTLDDFCSREIYRYNVFASEGSRVASCCRLINDVELMENYAAQSNSFGAGGSISLGSHRVVTVNLPRIALEAKSFDDFFTILDGRIKDAAKILKAHKALIKRLTDAGLQPFISNGWIKLDRMFSTFGIIGTYETASAIEKKFGNAGEIDIQGVVLKFFNERVMEYSKEFGIAGNIEQIPGESFAVRLRDADELIFGKEKMDEFYPEPLYSNQPIPLWHEADIWERLSEDGKYNSLITGGGIVHATIGEKVTKKQAKSIIRYSVKTGCEHFALNSIYSKCKNGHMTFGKSNKCPSCGENIEDWFTRVVGFFVPVSAMNKTRRTWEFPRRKITSISE